MRENAHRPNYKLSIVTAGITYLHREKFRSAMMVKYSEPITLRTVNDDGSPSSDM